MLQAKNAWFLAFALGWLSSHTQTYILLRKIRNDSQTESNDYYKKYKNQWRLVFTLLCGAPMNIIYEFRFYLQSLDMFRLAP